MPTSDERRRARRIRYAKPGESPKLKLVTAEYTIIDVSQTGIKIGTKQPKGFTPGQRLSARLNFPGGSTFIIDGVVVRIDSDGVAIHLSVPLPPEFHQVSMSDRRAFFRLRYPITERPRMQMLTRQYVVTEISEGGIRLRPTVLADFPVGSELNAVLAFHDGESLTVNGTVYRHSGDEVVIRLPKGIPESRIFAEQRYILKKYQHL